MKKLDIIIPIYNEGSSIINLIEKLNENISFNFNILICYDSDEDSSLPYLYKLNNKNIIFVKNPNKGPNSAILEGIKISDSNILLVYMADDYENISIIEDMTNLIDNGYDLVIPSRFISGGVFEGASFFKKYITIMGSLAIYYLAQLPFNDCTNAFKMFKKELKNHIIFKSKYGFTFAFELTIKSYLLNFNIVEYPSIWKENTDRKSNFKVVNWLPFYFYWLIYSFINIYFKKIKNIFS